MGRDQQAPVVLACDVAPEAVVEVVDDSADQTRVVVRRGVVEVEPGWLWRRGQLRRGQIRSTPGPSVRALLLSAVRRVDLRGPGPVRRSYFVTGLCLAQPASDLPGQPHGLSIKREKFHGEWNYTIRPK